MDVAPSTRQALRRSSSTIAVEQLALVGRDGTVVLGDAGHEGFGAPRDGGGTGSVSEGAGAMRDGERSQRRHRPARHDTANGSSPERSRLSDSDRPGPTLRGCGRAGAPAGGSPPRDGAAQGGRVEHVEVAGATVGVVDDRQQPALVVAVAVHRPDEERLARRAPRTRAPRRDLVTRPGRTSARPTGRDLGAPVGGSAPPARAAVRQASLECVAVPEGGTLAQRVHPWILDVAFVDLRPLDSLAHDAPPFQHGQRPRRSPSSPMPAGPTTDAERSTGLADLGHAVAADVEDDRPSAAAPLPRTGRPTAHGRLVDAPGRASPGRDRVGSTAPRTVTSPRHHADPAFGPGHPSERHGADAAPRRRSRRGRRLDEHDVLRRHPDVVLPGRPLQRRPTGRSAAHPRRPTRRCAGRSPRRHRRRSTTRQLPSSTPNRTRAAIGGHPVHVRGDRRRSGRRRTPLARRNREYCERNPGSRGARAPSPACQKHPGVGIRLLTRVRDGLAVAELDGVQRPGGLPPASAPAHRRAVTVTGRPPHRPTPPPTATPAPPGTGSPGGQAATSPTSAGSDPLSIRSPAATRSPRDDRRRTPMRPINLPAYGKVEACPRSRRTSPSAA